MELRQRIGRNIRRLADKQGISLNRLSLRAGVTRSAFFRAINAEGAMTTDSLAKVAHALEVDAAALLAAPE